MQQLILIAQQLLLIGHKLICEVELISNVNVFMQIDLDNDMALSRDRSKGRSKGRSQSRSREVAKQQGAPVYSVSPHQDLLHTQTGRGGGHHWVQHKVGAPYEAQLEGGKGKVNRVFIVSRLLIQLLDRKY